MVLPLNEQLRKFFTRKAREITTSEIVPVSAEFLFAAVWWRSQRWDKCVSQIPPWMTVQVNRMNIELSYPDDFNSDCNFNFLFQPVSQRSVAAPILEAYTDRTLTPNTIQDFEKFLQDLSEFPEVEELRQMHQAVYSNAKLYSLFSNAAREAMALLKCCSDDECLILFPSVQTLLLRQPLRTRNVSPRRREKIFSECPPNQISNFTHAIAKLALEQYGKQNDD